MPLPGSWQCCRQDVLPLSQLVALFVSSKVEQSVSFYPEATGTIVEFCGLTKGINAPLKRKADIIFIRRSSICGTAKVNAFSTLQ